MYFIAELFLLPQANFIEKATCRNKSLFLVGVTGFEPAASWSQRNITRYFLLIWAFFSPFRSENYALWHSYPHMFRVLRNGRWSVMWSAGFLRINMLHRLSFLNEGHFSFLPLLCYCNSEEDWIQVKICAAIDKEKGTAQNPQIKTSADLYDFLKSAEVSQERVT